jgi:hypothetical protein
LAVGIALGALLLMATASAAGAQSGNQNGQGQNQNGPTVHLSATPELDSALLFASGLVGVAGYGALRWRTRRK